MHLNCDSNEEIAFIRPDCIFLISLSESSSSVTTLSFWYFSSVESSESDFSSSSFMILISYLKVRKDFIPQAELINFDSWSEDSYLLLSKFSPMWQLEPLFSFGAFIEWLSDSSLPEFKWSEFTSYCFANLRASFLFFLSCICFRKLYLVISSIVIIQVCRCIVWPI